MKGRFLLLTAFISLFVAAVKREDFKKCAESSFCERQTDIQGNYGNYRLVKPKFDEKECVVVGRLEYVNEFPNYAYDKPLKFVMQILRKEIVHMTVDEVDPLYKRYYMSDAIHTDAQNTGCEIASVKVDESMMVIKSGGGLSVLILLNPFKVRVFSGNKLVMEVNSGNLFHFEQYRRKEVLESLEQRIPINRTVAKDMTGMDDDPKFDVAENATEPEEQEVEYEVRCLDEFYCKHKEKLFDEKFHTHHDSKVRGPSSIGIDVEMHAKRVYGLPEHADDFKLKSTVNIKKGDVFSDPYRLYNLDVFEYEVGNNMALYGSVPFLVGVDDDGTSTGVFWLNPSEMWIDIDNESEERIVFTHWMAEAGILDFYFFIGQSPGEISEQYTWLTGRPQHPRKMATMYHQCRWNYKDTKDVEEVNSRFDEENIPVDVIWLDIEHTEAKKYFTWEKTTFEKPKELQEKLAERKRYMVTIVDPHIKKDDNYYVYKEGTNQRMFVLDRDGKDFDGHCWPGASRYVDFLKPEAREWWSSLFSFKRYEGSTPSLFLWNDMNEPSVFSGPEVSMHKDAIHNGIWEHREVHNAYGFFNVKSTFDGLKKRISPQERPFVLTRSFFSGSQRYAAVWTGDNNAEWSHLEMQTKMLLSLSIAGITFCGADVGGFFNNPSPELLARWYQAASFTPFFRGHAHIDTDRKEPWVHGEPWTTVIGDAIRERYHLHHYWYTLFHEASVSGDLIMRPLWYDFPRIPETYEIENAFMVGKHILVHPVVKEAEESVEVFLPRENSKDSWYNYHTLDEIPVVRNTDRILHEAPLDGGVPCFIKGGSIIPYSVTLRRSSELMEEDPMTLIIALDQNEQAEGQIYIDDGKSYRYENGEFNWKSFYFMDGSLSLENVRTPKREYNSDLLVERIIIVGLKRKPTLIKLVRGDEVVSDEIKFSFQDSDRDNQKYRITIKKPGLKMDGKEHIELAF